MTDSNDGARCGEAQPNADQKKTATDNDYYFNFYASLQNQANMIGDVSRTATYRKAILGNAAIAIRDKVVLDLGAGSGILSYMSAQAGAREVIALEASSMADKIQIVRGGRAAGGSATTGLTPQLVDEANRLEANPHLAGRIRIVRGMVEDKAVQKEVLSKGKVDTIVSEPIGVMLLHERMVESFLLARDLFLKPGGTILPGAGHIFFCPFSDEGLFNETEQKAQFFNQTLFGTDFSALYDTARIEVFSQPVVGIFPPTSLISVPCAPKTFDFYRCTITELLDFVVPIDFIASRTAVMHGLASWFDLDFEPSAQSKAQVADDAGDAAAAESWDFAIPVPTWQWMTAEPPLNPGPTPEPPAKGVKVTLSTGPAATRTHWQQARLLLPEPLAVNRSERVVGSIRFKVNNARSYDLTLDLAVDRPGGPATGPNPLRRTATYNLAQQTFKCGNDSSGARECLADHYSYSYTGEPALPSVVPA